MANFICINIYFLCLTILCIRGEDLLSVETKAEKTFPFQSVLLQKLLQNKWPLPGSEALGSIIGDNLPLHKKIEHGFDFSKVDSIFQQNLPFLRNDQEGKGSDFPKIDSVFGENLPFQKTDKSKNTLDFPKTDSTFSDNLSPHPNHKPDESVKSDVQGTDDGTYNYVYLVQVTPNISVRSIIVANISCNYGYRKDKTGKCRKML